MNFLLGLILAISHRHTDSVLISYSYHSQSCHLWWAEDFYWNLQLNESGKFIFSETIRDSRNYTLNIKERKAPKFNYRFGTWEKRNDSLFLYTTGATLEPYEKSSKSVCFLIKDSLITQVFSETNGFPQNMNLVLLKSEQTANSPIRP